MKNKIIADVKIKIKYFEERHQASGLSPKTIAIKERIVNSYEKSVGLKSFKEFSSDDAIKYKQFLFAKEPPLSLATISYHLSTMKDFFNWLSFQPGYKHITKTDIDYFNMTRGERNTLNSSGTLLKTPTIEQVVALLNSIPNNTELNKRDRALIIFLLLSGIRVDSVISIPIGAYDRLTHIVTLNPLEGVKTKFSKILKVQVLPFQKELMDEFEAYIDYLLYDKKFQMNYPLFPATIVKIKEGTNKFNADTLSSKFWQGSNSVRDMIKKHCQAAGLEYFSPHSYRRLHVQHANKYMTNIEELVAFSQNLGHENIQTTYKSYSKYEESEKQKILSNIDFTKSSRNNDSVLTKIDERLAKIESEISCRGNDRSSEKENR